MGTNATSAPVTLGANNGSTPTIAAKDNNTMAQLTWVKLACFTVIVVVGLIGNFVISIATLTRRKLQAADRLVLNLAATDMATCLISIPFDFVVVVTANWPFGVFLCHIIYPLQTVLMAVSVYTLLVMSWERHRVVLHPSKPKIKTTRTLAIILLIWVASFAVVGPYFAIPRLNVSQNGTECKSESGWPSKSHAKAFTLAVFILLYLLPLLLITINYICISQKLWRDIQRLKRALGVQPGIKKPLVRARAHRNMNIVRVFVLAVVAFAACMAPNHVMWMWLDYGTGTFEYSDSVLVFCHILVYANSAINPFVFMLLHRRFCKQFLIEYGLCFCCVDREKVTEQCEERPARLRLDRLQRNAPEMRNDILREMVPKSPTYKAVRQFHYDLPDEPGAENLRSKQDRRTTRVNFKTERGVHVYQLS